MSGKNSVSIHQKGVASSIIYTKAELKQIYEEWLLAAYPGQLQLDFDQAATIIGVSSGHISNMEYERTPLFPSVRIGRKRLVQTHDLVDFLIARRLKAQVRRGPKTKAERYAADLEGGAI